MSRHANLSNCGAPAGSFDSNIPRLTVSVSTCSTNAERTGALLRRDHRGGVMHGQAIGTERRLHLTRPAAGGGPAHLPVISRHAPAPRTPSTLDGIPACQVTG